MALWMSHRSDFSLTSNRHMHRVGSMNRLGVVVLFLLASVVSAFLLPTWKNTSETPNLRDSRDSDMQRPQHLMKTTENEAVRDVREHPLQKVKKTVSNQLSFEECNINPGMREECGYYGIGEMDCYGRGCCWEETEEGVPWCYLSV